jgi:hypothetical protein
MQKFHLLIVSSFIFIALFSCKKDDFETNANAKLDFSEDTLVFDTVFTTVGSATEYLVVYNNNSKPVKISSIRIATGESSNFRLNVDGVAGKSFTDIEIGAEDSMFIFAEVTVDPNSLTTPLIISDSIIFITNGNMQDVDLVAWGQDAYFHRTPPNSQIDPFFFLDCNENWHNDKPHVIYGIALVDSACSLTIDAGTNVFFHPGSGIITATCATLLVNGTQQDKVTIQGDRLGEQFKDIPGQWSGIWLSSINFHSELNAAWPGPKNSVIKNAIIKNGITGLHVDTSFDNTSLALRMENTIIKNMAGAGLFVQGSRIEVYNSVFANCGAQTAQIQIGGDYKFYHCTFANFWNNGTRQQPAVSLNNHYEAATGDVIRNLDAKFYNCIVYGTNETELGLDSFPVNGQFNFLFDHALIKLENSFNISNSHYVSVIKATNSGNNPAFADTDNNVYKLDSLNSPALEAGDLSILLADPVLNFDIDGISRPQRLLPDLGAFERQ